MKVLYDTLLKRTSTYAVGVFGAVFFFERAFDIVSEQIFTTYNRGKLWDDIKKKYE